MADSRLQSIVQWLAVAAVVCFALQVFSDNKADVDLWGNVGFVQAFPGAEQSDALHTVACWKAGEVAFTPIRERASS